ncbi:hypothetical protein C8T65DRAFT_158428 [Cerioporus squamosus]|nr:hypothetical protein C8T65DRAFT_158428 [Cerioporus squamosus]
MTRVNVPQNQNRARAMIGRPRRCSFEAKCNQNDNEIRSGHMADIAEDWLLDPAIASQSGMLVTVHGSLPTRRSSGWHNGAYEDAQAVVLSVFNTGPGNTTFASTARVKLLKPLNPDMNTFVVPASYLHPVKPDDVGQDAVIIGGEYIGSLARLREEVSEGWFFVSAAYDHFEIKAANLVRVLLSTIERLDFSGNYASTQSLDWPTKHRTAVAERSDCFMYSPKMFGRR